MIGAPNSPILKVVSPSKKNLVVLDTLALPDNALILPTGSSNSLYEALNFRGPDAESHQVEYIRTEKIIEFSIFGAAAMRADLQDLERRAKNVLLTKYQYFEIIRYKNAQFDHALGQTLGEGTGTRAHPSINKKQDPVKGASVPALFNTAKNARESGMEVQPPNVLYKTSTSDLQDLLSYQLNKTMNFIKDKIQSDYRFKNYIEVKDQIQDGMTKAA